MDVTKPVLCVSSLKDLTLSDLVQWLRVYRNQVVLWHERCPSDHPQVVDLLERLSGNLLTTMATLEELIDEMETMPQSNQEVPTRRTCGPDGTPTPASDK